MREYNTVKLENTIQAPGGRRQDRSAPSTPGWRADAPCPGVRHSTAPCGVHHVVHSGVSRKRWADAGGGAPSSQSWQTAPPPFLHTIDNLSPLPFPQLARGIRSRNVTSFDARENSSEQEAKDF